MTCLQPRQYAKDGGIVIPTVVLHPPRLQLSQLEVKNLLSPCTVKGYRLGPVSMCSVLAVIHAVMKELSVHIQGGK